MKMNEKLDSKVWWGNFVIPADSSIVWHIGPMDFQVSNKKYEWIIYRRPLNNLEDDSIDIFRSNEPAISDGIIKRFASCGDLDKIVISPQLADIPVVARPEVPFYVPSNEDITVYISSPLWVRVKIENSNQFMEDFPILQPHYTWFGSSSINGEICYASRTHARLSLEHLPKRSFRAVTAVKISNRTNELLLVDRIKVPVNNLNLHYSSSGQIYTDSLKFIKESVDTLASVHISNQPLINSDSSTLLAKARIGISKNVVMKVFNSIF